MEEIIFLCCPECGNEQPDMGVGVRCEECGFCPLEPMDPNPVKSKSVLKRLAAQKKEAGE